MGAAAVPAAIIGSGVIGGVASKLSADKAAKAQQQAAQSATDTQMQMFNRTQENLAPYLQSGGYANKLLMDRIPSLTSPIVMDQATLENTPGYQFILKQGQKAVQNSAAARGLGTSGAALKGAASYATGLADSTYQQQFENAVTNQSNAYNRLLSAAGLGENAAAGVGNAAVTTGKGIAENTIGAGNAAAGAYLQGGNAIGSAAGSVAGGLLTNKLLDNPNLFGGGNGGAGSDFYGNVGTPSGYASIFQSPGTESGYASIF